MDKKSNGLILALAAICVVVILCLACGMNQWYAVLAYWIVLLIKNWNDWKRGN